MSEISEAIEKAKEGGLIEGGEGFNRKVALIIAILALFLAFAETLGKGAQTEVTTKNIEASDLWGFFQAKNIRMTTITTAAEGMAVVAAGTTDPAAKDAMQKQIEAWKKNVVRIDTEAKTGRKEIEEQAKAAEEERDLATAKYHHYELSSAAFQVGIVLASAAVITGMVGLVWMAGLFGAVGLALGALGLLAPHAVPFIATL